MRLRAQVGIAGGVGAGLTAATYLYHFEYANSPFEYAFGALGNAITLSLLGLRVVLFIHVWNVWGNWK